ncbi:MAG TPA: hypothetical protein VLV50_10580 [Stellaceae bacterium]|nr:hypothetical protein [Stellaceae bacterium]
MAEATALSQDEFYRLQSRAFAWEPFDLDEMYQNLPLTPGDFARRDLLADPAAGLRQVVRSLQENVRLQQILDDAEALRTAEPASRRRGAGTLSAAGAALALPTGQDERTILGDSAEQGGTRTPARAAAASGQAASDPELPAPGTDDEISINDGETLRQALRNLVGTRGGGAQAESSTPGAGDDDPAFGLGQNMLNSRVLGEAFDAFVRRNGSSDYDMTFSILGLGRFSFDLGSNGNFEITEYGSGMTLAVREHEPAARRPSSEALDLLTKIRTFLATPAGTLTAVAGTVLLLVLGMVRMVAVLKR